MSRLKLESDQSAKADVEAISETLSFGERLKNAFRTTMPLWVVALIGLFIPVLHFVIVPSAVLAILWFGGRELATAVRYTAPGIKCPHCGTAYSESVFRRLPKRLVCPQCRITSELSAN